MMPARTLFSSLVRRCGLTVRQAAPLLEVSEAAAASYACGRRPAPQRLLARLAELDAEIDAAAEALASAGGATTWTAAANDAEAQALGWPAAGTHAEVLARAWLMTRKRGDGRWAA
jgi:hypothetical protein